MPEPTPQRLPGDEQEPSQYSSKTVRGDFLERKSIEAQARRKAARAERREMLERFAEEAGFDEYLEQFTLLRELGTKEALKQTAKNIAQRIILRRLSPWLFGIALTICFWQFVFALLSLMGYGMHAMVLAFKQDNWVGQMLSTVWDFEKYFPGEMIGAGFWGVATLVGVGGFIGFMLFFHLLGITLMRSTISTLVLMICLSLTFLPVSNIIPWLVIWVWNVIRTETSIFGMALEHHRTKRTTVPQT